MKNVLIILMFPMFYFGQNLILFDSLMVSDDGVFMHNKTLFNGTAFANNSSGKLLYEKDFVNGKK